MHPPAPAHRISRSLIALGAAALMVVPVAVALVPAQPAMAVDNEITIENSLPGSPASEWDISGSGDQSIQGFATQTSVGQGETVDFKIDTTAADYRVDIYRLGWYQGNGARKVATIDTAATTERDQPNCVVIDGNRDDNLVDCGNWSVSASWAVPADAASGVYIAKPTRADNNGASHIVFVVRDDDGNSDLLMQTSDTTWQAYNPYGGYNVYPTGSTGVNAQKVSYNRPVTTRSGERESYLFSAEYPMIRWLERNGYDVSYTSHRDTGLRPAELLEHRAFLSVGHDEYWSQEERDAVEAARDAGVNLAFFSGNEVYWKTRYEDSTQNGAAGDQRTMVAYKEGSAAASPDEHQRCYNNFSCDPSDSWTGLWRESPASTSGNSLVGEPENALTGQISWSSDTAAMTVPGEFAGLRFWRNTDVASLSASGRVTLPNGLVGYEWNPESSKYAAWYPPGRVLLSNTTIGSQQHSMSLYRASSGALVFGAGTIQWSWGLDAEHEYGDFMSDPGDTSSRTVQQATMNLLADMGAQPATPQSNLVVTAGSTDATPPTVNITSSVASVTGPGSRTVSGTASDVGGVVGVVEVSTDGGSSWQRASGKANWSHTFTALAGTPAIRVRAADDSANLSATVSLGIAPTACPDGTGCSTIFPQSVTGAEVADPAAVELGVKFRSDVGGQVKGIRFFKTAGNTGAHTGSLWSASGQRLATVTFGSESATGWQEASFSAPVTIEPNTTYIASYFTTSGRYAMGTSFANAGVDSPPLHALRGGTDGPNGVYRYGSGGVVPTSSWESANYLVDVLFTPVIPVDETAPTVTATAPQADAISADPAANITASFSEAMDPASITATTFELRDPAGAVVPATVTYNGSTGRAVLDPTAALAGGTRYTATVKGGPDGVADAAGNPLAQDLTWSFRTSGANTTAPLVTATTPTAGATGAKVDANLTVVFSEAMDPASITPATVELRDAAGNAVATTVSYDAATTSAIVVPSAPLAFATQHTVTVRGGAGGVRDAGGMPLQADVNVKFTTAGPDTTPPSVVGTWPVRDAADFGVDAEITAIFNEDMAPVSMTGTTVQLRTSSGSLVNAVISYDAATKAVVINPSTPLAHNSEYTVTIVGGAGGVTDAAGNPMVGTYSWTFATVPMTGGRPNPDIGPGGPVLIVKGTSEFGAYLPEMVRGEGLNLFTVRTTSSFTATALAPYDTVVLGETTLTAAQVTALTDWVNAGGNLIVMRPSGSLAGLLGLTLVGGTVSEGYIKVDTTTVPGKGIEATTMQFHGAADLYRPLAGTQVLAQLYSNGTTATEYPAVTTRSVGTAGGSATAFTFDLARSVVYTRQGNPAWSGQERDGYSPLRSNDLFYVDYLDMSKVSIPQADEQQRLLANIITETTRDVLPVPRFWYLPRGGAAAIVMTADEHNSGNVPSRFANELARSAANCDVADWECIRSTSYHFVDYSLISDAQAVTYEQQGFELGLHPNSGCGDVNRAQFAALMSEQLVALARNYPSITPPKTSRNHCIFWIGYTTVPEEEEKLGIHLDTNYYYWPPEWAGTRPGMFTGSAMPQRFLSTTGDLVDVYQATTQMTDESGQAYPSTAIALMDNAIDKGYYGAYVANLHTDGPNAGAYHDAVITAAAARGIPIITAEQLLDWTDGRNSSSFTNLSRSGGTVTFTLNAGSGANGLQAMLPTEGSTGTLQSISRSGSNVTFQTKVVKGVSYAVFNGVAGNYTATYQVDSTAPTISEPLATMTGGTSAEVTWRTNEAATSRVEYGTSAGSLTLSSQSGTLSTSHLVRLNDLAPETTYYYRTSSADAFGNTTVWPAAGSPPATFTTAAAAAADTTFAEFGAGTPGTATYVSNSAGGEVMLAPVVGAEFEGTGVPSGWTTGAWTGGTPSFTGGAANVDGSWLRTSTSVGSGRAVEFAATFNGTAFQNAGFAVTLAGTGESWAMFGTSEISGVLQARTRNAGGTVVDVPLGSQFIGSEHVFRIEWDSSVRFYVDGALVHTAATVGGSMRPLVSDFSTGGGGLNVKWMRLTPHSGSGSFVSRVHDAGTVANWGMLGPVATVPAGTTLAYDVRTGNTATPDGTWTSFAPIAAGQDIPNAARYLQYRARFTTSNGYVTPSLTAMRLPYTTVPPTPDTTPPVISAVGATVTGQSTASIAWVTDEQSTTRVEYGEAPDELDASAQNPTLATNHAITLTGLTPATEYFFRVVSTDAAGNTATSATSSFTTQAPDTTAPKITARTPAPDATNTAVGADVTVSFDEPMNAATFTTSTFTLRADGASVNVPASVTASGATATLNPTANLAPGTRYTATVAQSVTDAAGNPLGSNATWSFTTASSVATTLEDTTSANFGAGTPGSATYVANSAGGEVMLAPVLGSEFEGTGVPSGWTTGAWTGGNTTFSGGAANVDGSWLRTSGSVGAGHVLEFTGTFTGAPFQNAGFGVTLSGASESWAMFGTSEVSGVLRARIRSAGGTVVDVALGSQYVGSEHKFRIEWGTNVRFFIDDALVHTADGVTGSMRPLVSDYTNGGGGITMRWMRVTPLAPTVSEEFNGSTLPSGWTSSFWAGGIGGSTVAGGNVTVNGGLLRGTTLSGPGSSVEFPATFGAAAYQHAGFGVDLAGTSRWAMFSTNGTTDTLYARTNNNGTVSDTSLGTGLVGSSHTYRIDWLADRIVFSVDGVVRHTQNVAISGTMGPVVSDYAAGGPGVIVGSIRMSPAARTGVFISRVLDAGKSADWQALAVAAQVPAGTGIVIEVRTGSVATPDGSWTQYTPVSAGADIPNSGRYIQYRATLTGTTTTSPVLERVGIGALVAP